MFSLISFYIVRTSLTYFYLKANAINIINEVKIVHCKFISEHSALHKNSAMLNISLSENGIHYAVRQIMLASAILVLLDKEC